MDEDISVLDVLQSMMESDRDFYQVLRFLSPNRQAALTFHQQNTAAILNILRVIVNPRRHTNVTYTATIPINLPAGWNDPVVVAPTAAEIRAATSTHAVVPPDLNCSICQEGITEPGSTRIVDCGHLFHPNCISEWFTRSVHCPMCRYDIRGVSTNVPTSFETTNVPLQVNSPLDAWLAEVGRTDHTEDTEGSV